MTMETEGLERVYITAELEQEHRLMRLRDEVYGRVGGSQYYTKVKPHITVVPPFYFDKERIEVVEGLVEDSEIAGRTVEFDRLKVWESINDPEYVMMDVNVDIRERQLELVDRIRDENGEYMKSPVPPHMTLFKSNDLWDEPTVMLKSDIEDCMGDYQSIQPTEISEVKVVMG